MPFHFTAKSFLVSSPLAGRLVGRYHVEEFADNFQKRKLDLRKSTSLQMSKLECKSYSAQLTGHEAAKIDGAMQHLWILRMINQCYSPWVCGTIMVKRKQCWFVFCRELRHRSYMTTKRRKLGIKILSCLRNAKC